MVKFHLNGWLKLACVLVAGVALAACGNASAAGNQPVTVQVTLNDFSIQSSLTTFTVGTPYHFVVSNKAGDQHEFVIMPPVADPSQLDAERKLAVASISSQQLKPGATATLDVTFTKAAPAGTLEFACHLPGHYEAGMKLPIVVK